LEETIGGRVGTREEEFFLKNRLGSLEFTLVAEGLRKIALLLVLVQNGSLVLDDRGEDNVLFWDELESNLNPRLIRVLVETLLEIARAGTQVFVATHDYVVLKELDLRATRDDDILWHALYFDDDGAVRCETQRRLEDIGRNAIAATFADLYDREIDRLTRRPAETV
jgi:predicted ATPase